MFTLLFKNYSYFLKSGVSWLWLIYPLFTCSLYYCILKDKVNDQLNKNLGETGFLQNTLAIYSLFQQT